MEKVKYRKSLNDYEDVQRMQSYYFEQGEEKGFAKGEAKGVTETKRQLALNMLAKGLDLSLVSEISGLTKEEVLALPRE